MKWLLYTSRADAAEAASVVKVAVVGASHVGTAAEVEGAEAAAPTFFTVFLFLV